MKLEHGLRVESILSKMEMRQPNWFEPFLKGNLVEQLWESEWKRRKNDNEEIWEIMELITLIKELLDDKRNARWGW